jgi:hypothetical protein
MKLNIAAISKRIAAAGTAAMPKNSRRCDRNSLWIRSSSSPDPMGTCGAWSNGAGAEVEPES